jgi:nucleotide-binding universal stress UspA family protein
MFRKMLVPLDGSTYSECVLDHAKVLATGCNVGEVVLLYVVEPMYPGVYDIPQSAVEEAQRSSLNFGKEYLARISGKLKEEGIAATTDVAQGRAADAILDYAESHGVDLIIMSTHGRSGVTRWLVGSVADRVIRSSPIPVLLITPPGCRVQTKE